MDKTFRHIMTLAAAALLTLPFAACTNEDTPAGDGTAVSARITAQIASTGGTRASGTTWDSGDSFGLSTDNSSGSSSTVADNLKYTTINGTDFTGEPVYFQDNEDVKFIAYYPYDTSDDDLITVSTADLTQQKSFDFLYATATASRLSPDVNLQFSHRMGQLTLTFKAGKDIIDLSGLTACTLKGLYMDGTFSKSTGEAAANTSASKVDLPVSLSGISGTTYTAQPLILFPQGEATDKVAIEVTLDGNTYNAEMSWPNGKLEAGSNVNCNITINKTSLSMNCSIVAWSAATTVSATAKRVNSTFSDPAQAAIGDLILKDGTFISKDYLPLLNDKQRSEVAGVVFWTTKDTDPTGRTTPASLSDDKIMAADYPGCKHGLAVAAKSVGRMAWQETTESVEDFQNSTNFTHSLKSQFKSIASGYGATDPINYILGYQNTQVLKAYNEYCKKAGKADNVVLPVDSLSGFETNFPAPNGSTGWYIPSVKELHMLCYKDVDNLQDVYGATCTETRNIVQASLSAAGGDQFDTFTYYIYASNERNSKRNMFVTFYNFFEASVIGYIYEEEKYMYDEIRAVCAF